VVSGPAYYNPLLKTGKLVLCLDIVMVAELTHNVQGFQASAEWQLQPERILHRPARAALLRTSCRAAFQPGTGGYPSQGCSSERVLASR
jgi:hypothetical protein